MSRWLRIAGVVTPLALILTLVARRERRTPSPPLIPYHSAERKLLILGAGFGGFSVAQHLAGRLPAEASVLALDRHDFLTFWPMVPETIPASIEVQHALRPLPAELVRRGVNFLQAEVEEVDLHARRVKTSRGEFEYDRLVIALGWETNFFGVPGAEEHGLTVQSIEDAIRIRDRVIDSLEAAAAEVQAGRRAGGCALHFAVVGGGSTGVEVAANLRELLYILLPQYPALSSAETKVHLLQAGDDVLPHMDQQLRRIAAARLGSEDIEVRTDARVARVDGSGVELSDGSRVEAELVVWAAGVRSTSLVSKIKGAAADDKGRLEVDEFLRLKQRTEVYALGDVAAVSSDGKPVPPTAQATVQEAAVVAENLLAGLSGGDLRPFTYHPMGTLVDLGSRFAVSQVMGRRVSGRLAQMLWRGVYLYKLGDGRDRLEVMLDWLVGWLAGPRVTRLPGPHMKARKTA